MSVESGFFNSVNGDRTYNADNISNFFGGILNDGVFKNYNGDLAVTAGSGLSVNVAGGKAMIFSKYILNTGQLNLPLAGASSMPRYDAVVIGVDLENRIGEIYIKTGTPGVTPSYPTILNTDNAKELCLAYVYVAAGATTIINANIIDSRSDTSVCGYIKFTNISANLNVLRNNVNITANDTINVSIGIPSFDAATDTLFVYLNGILMIETNEYVIKGTGSTASIDLAEKIIDGSGNNVFTFIVFKMEI